MSEQTCSGPRFRHRSVSDLIFLLELLLELLDRFLEYRAAYAIDGADLVALAGELGLDRFDLGIAILAVIIRALEFGLFSAGTSLNLAYR